MTLENYPDGAANDPNAPYNQPDMCEECEDTGRVPDKSTMTLKPNGEPDSCQEDMPCPTCAALESSHDRRLALEENHWDAQRKGEN